MSVIKEIGNNFLVTPGRSERSEIISVDDTSELHGASLFVHVNGRIDLVVRYMDLIEPIIRGKCAPYFFVTFVFSRNKYIPLRENTLRSDVAIIFKDVELTRLLQAIVYIYSFVFIFDINFYDRSSESIASFKLSKIFALLFWRKEFFF